MAAVLLSSRAESATNAIGRGEAPERGSDEVRTLQCRVGELTEALALSRREADALRIRLARYEDRAGVVELRPSILRRGLPAELKVLDVNDIPSQVQEKSTGSSAVKIDAELTVDEMEKQMIVQALEKTGGNRTKAAEKLGISRRTLHRKLNEYEIN